MKWVNDLKTGVKLFSSFGAVILLMIVIAVVGYAGMKNIDAGMTTLYIDRTVPIHLLGIANMEESNLRIYLNGMIVFPENVKTYEQSINASITNINTQLDVYRASQLDLAEKDELAKFDKDWPLLQQQMTAIVKEVTAGKLEAAKALLGEGSQFKVTYANVESAMSKASEINVRLAEEIDAQGAVTFASSTNLLIMVVILSVLLAFGFGIVITRSITTPLSFVAACLQNISKGDLNRDVAQETKDSIVKRKDELGTAIQGLAAAEIYLQEMAHAAKTIAENNLTISIKPKSENDELGYAFDLMITNLRLLTLKTMEATGSISTSTSQISTAINEQAAAISEQASAVAETTSTIEEVRQAAEQTSDRTQIVSDMAGNSLELANRGLQTVSKSEESMQNLKEQVRTIAETILGLSEQTQQIGEITNTVNDIADQSNLLALNAAMEAARAGEAGRGFAVVAGEVRNLAELSKQATRQVSSILGEIQKAANTAVMVTEQGIKRAEDGVESTKATAETIRLIQEHTQQAATSAQQIAASTRQQLSGMDQITHAMVGINTGANQSQLGIRQIEEAANNLNDLATQLVNILQQYTVK